MESGGPSAGPSLVQATQASVAALSREGRLPPEEAELLHRLLLHEAEELTDHAAQGKLARVVGGGAMEVAGWANLPEVVAEGIFFPGGDISHQARHVTARSRLVCREWKRAVSAHCQAIKCAYSLEKFALLWAAGVKQRLPALKRLDLCCQTEGDEAGLGLEHVAAAYGPQLEDVSLSNLNASLSDLQGLHRHCTSLKRLSLNKRFADDRRPRLLELVNIISNMTSLTHLELRGLLWRLPGESRHLTALGSLTKLERLSSDLDLSGNLDYLMPRLTLLKSLELTASAPASSLLPLTHLQRLQHLSTHVPDNLLALVRVLVSMQALRTLHLTRTGYPRAPLYARLNQPWFPVAPQITELVITSADLEWGTMGNLAKALPGLEALRLVDCLSSSSDLPELQSLPALRELTISVANADGYEDDWPIGLFGPLRQPGLQNLRALQTLCMEGIDISSLLPSKDISLLLPWSLVALTLRNLSGHSADIDQHDFFEALRPAVGMETIALLGVLAFRADPGYEESDADDSKGENGADSEDNGIGEDRQQGFPLSSHEDNTHTGQGAAAGAYEIFVKELQGALPNLREVRNT